MNYQLEQFDKNIQKNETSVSREIKGLEVFKEANFLLPVVNEK